MQDVLPRSYCAFISLKTASTRASFLLSDISTPFSRSISSILCLISSLPDVAPITSFLSAPTTSGGKGSYTNGFFRTPAACMPLSCAKTFLPTTALLRGTRNPISLSTYSANSVRHSILYLWKPLTRSSRKTIIFSSSATPARSPMPRNVAFTQLAPCQSAAIDAAVPNPKSS